jgi:Tfp pilus assembly protein PilO
MKKISNILIVLALLDAIGVGIFWYGYTKVVDIKESETNLRSQLAEEKQKGQKLDALRNTLTSAAKDRAQLERYLIDPSDENQIQLISRVEHLGTTTTGVEVTTTSFDFQSSAKPPVLHGEFAVSGTWSRLYRFLRIMEEYPSRVVINRYDIHSTPSAAADKSNQEIWTGGISVDFAGLKQLQN